jgi:hypothetical protein
MRAKDAVKQRTREQRNREQGNREQGTEKQGTGNRETGNKGTRRPAARAGQGDENRDNWAHCFCVVRAWMILLSGPKWKRPRRIAGVLPATVYRLADRILKTDDWAKFFSSNVPMGLSRFCTDRRLDRVQRKWCKGAERWARDEGPGTRNEGCLQRQRMGGRMQRLQCNAGESEETVKWQLERFDRCARFRSRRGGGTGTRARDEGRGKIPSAAGAGTRVHEFRCDAEPVRADS